MKKIYSSSAYALCAFFIFIGQVAFSNIALAKGFSYDKVSRITSPSIKRLEEWIDQDTLVLITLDDVLMRPDYMMLSYDSPYRSFIGNLESKAISDRSYAGYVVSWYSQREMVLMEEEWLSFIEIARSKGANVYGFAPMPIDINDIEKYRYVELLNMGVQFTQTAGEQNVIALGKRRNWVSVFYQGVIYPGPLNIQKTIENLMKLSMIAPKKVIYFSNSYNDLSILGNALKKFEIDLKAIEYSAMEKYTPELNLDLIRFQQVYFLKHSKMLDDNEALQMMLQLSKKQPQGN